VTAGKKLHLPQLKISLPLFDPYSSVEMILLWFESLHPAVLLNQILAVNISMANFILQTFCPCINLRPVRESLLRLEGKSSIAFRLLNNGMIKSISNPIEKTDKMMDPFTYISPETVEACENVCSLIGDVEILQSRATSLLSKLNGDIELVQSIMESPEGRNIKVSMDGSRTELLNEILQQEERNAGITGNSSNLPSPSLREYILRNSDGNRPCQLTTAIGERLD
jgi:Rab3 GTPase-activating protein catalytic subunit